MASVTSKRSASTSIAAAAGADSGLVTSSVAPSSTRVGRSPASSSDPAITYPLCPTVMAAESRVSAATLSGAINARSIVRLPSLESST